MFDLGGTRRRRRPSLTPMIDVVFLLLVFFMLAAQFGADRVVRIPLTGAGGSYSGPPRLIDVLPGAVRLNGVAMDEDTLPDALGGLMDAPDDLLIMRGREGATLQRVIDLTDRLRAAGMTNTVLVE